MKKNVVVVSAARTPFGKLGGSLKNISCVDLSAQTMNEVVGRAKISKEMIDEVYLGVCVQSDAGGAGPVVARQALITGNFPTDIASVTLDRACCSGMTSIGFGYRSIVGGFSTLVLSAGADNMSRTPFFIKDSRWREKKIGAPNVVDPLILSYMDEPIAVYTGISALEHGVSREEQDEWALLSQQRFNDASKAGKFRDEIFPVDVSKGQNKAWFTEDEQPRPETTLEKLSSLSTVYGSPTVTAGNAPGLNDGGAGMILMSGEKASELGLEPLAEIIDYVGIAAEPKDSPGVPGLAIAKILDKMKMSLRDMSLIEINEAFAAMPLVSTKILSEKYGYDLTEIREKTNINGGAIAVGHPLAASGARIVMNLIFELKRRGGGYGVAAICGGMSQSDAIIVKVRG